MSGVTAGVCLLPRAQLLYTRLELSEVPKNQRREAVLLELEQKAPFAEPSGWAIWQGSRACVWYWPAELEKHALGGSPSGPVVIPETALWPELNASECRWVADAERGLYLLQFQHPDTGFYEKRYPFAPAADEVLAWFRRHGAVVEPTEINSQSVPELELSRGPLGTSLKPVSSSLEKRIFPAAAALLGFLLVVYCLALTRAWWETGQLRSERVELQTQVEDVVGLRNRAAELQAGNRLLGNIRQPSQLLISSFIAEALDVNTVRLIHWSYRNDQLELLWRPNEEAPDPTALIRQLEALPAFSDVQAEINPDGAVDIYLEVSGELEAVEAASTEEDSSESELEDEDA